MEEGGKGGMGRGEGQRAKAFRGLATQRIITGSAHIEYLFSLGGSPKVEREAKMQGKMRLHLCDLLEVIYFVGDLL